MWEGSPPAEVASGGVLQDVDAAEPGGGVLERPGERVTVEYVCGERGGGDALGAELADEAIELLAVAGDQGDVEPCEPKVRAMARPMPGSAPMMAMLVTAILSQISGREATVPDMPIRIPGKRLAQNG
jgi:hypothetical protein